MPLPRPVARSSSDVGYFRVVTVLVTGGAGYIGAHIVRCLQEASKPVVVVDDLSTGDRARIPGVRIDRLDLARQDVGPRLVELMREEGVNAVVHLAAKKRVDESVARPTWYADQNIGGLVHLLDAVREASVESLVFSSSAAVYGNVSGSVVSEDAAAVPVNPYGESKLMGEWLVRDVARAWGLRVASLRYFNVAGAGWPELGDTAVLNLVTMVLERLTSGERPVVFGDDYPTADGTCVRDFVHVLDLARAHVAVLDHLTTAPEGTALTYNVGTSQGTSVAQVVDRLIELVGSDVQPEVRPRRAGDPAQVVADAGRLAAETGWTARADLDAILRSAVGAWRARTA